ncbi:MAG: multidrug effflux MFS transporter [Alphaproteobacteria bacterium]|jgi:MFS transporter, DHA1 family, multidrug resistance protein|nr:multidrug effflux MFS transporter [Alphaproteobacteria bacterium]MBT4965042.1 multidrug effflux MFS transporter [Alphaproteobacteria bacterium]MBT5159578.1 multidrug effflux MFS transporter [Alphaproteobacteria bacterium]
MTKRTVKSGQKGTFTVLAVLVAISTLGATSTQMFLPALPAMQSTFGASSTTAQLTLSAAMFAMAFSQIIYGPWSDRVGRKPVLFFGLTLYVIGTVVCLSAGNVQIMIFGRILQACGGGVGAVLAGAIAVDKYGSANAAPVISLVAAVMAIGPMLAPSIGGILTDTIGWRSVFAVMLGLGVLVIVVATLLLPETRLQKQTAATPGQSLRVFASLLKSRTFMAYGLNAAFSMGAFFAFISAAPFVTVNIFERPSTEFGLWFVSIAIGYVVGNLLSAKMVKQKGGDWLIGVGSLLLLAATFAMPLMLQVGGWTPWAIFLPAAVMSFAAGLSIPNAQAAAIGHLPMAAGTASSLIGFLMLMSGAIASQIVGIMQDGTPWPMVITMALMGFLSLAAFIARNKVQTKNVLISV